MTATRRNLVLSRSLWSAQAYSLRAVLGQLRHVQVTTICLALSYGGWQTMANEIALERFSDTEHQQISELMRELRNIKRDDLFVPVARLQLLHLTDLIDKAGDLDAETVNDIRRFARGVAFNIASFTWPGWDDTGPIPLERQQLGLSAARVGLALAEAAEDVTPNILWINGVHEINAGEFENAIATFTRAKSVAKNSFFKSMHDAWIALTRHLMNPTDASRTALDIAVEAVKTGDDPDAEFYAQQLSTALTVFLRPQSEDTSSSPNTED